MDIKIRELSQVDNSQFRELWTHGLTENDEYFRTSILDDPTPDIPTDFNEDSFTLGAFAGDELVGILSLKRDVKVKLSHKALLFAMYVLPSLGRNGLGKMLLEAAIVKARQNPFIRQLYLTVLSSNVRARNLYSSFGFEVYANEPKSVMINGEYVDECRMVLFV